MVLVVPFVLDGVVVVNSECCTAIFAIGVVVGFGVYFLVLSLVITGAMDVGVIFVVTFDVVFVFGLYVLALALVSTVAIISAVVDDRSASSVILEMVG